MIPRITRGSSAYGALHYDHGPGRRDEHRNPHKVAGNVAGRTWRERSYAIDDHVKRTNPKLTNPIIRTSLRIAPEDRNLTDREWRQIASEYVEKMGFSEAPWEAVRHADDHIHLTMSRAKWDGTVVDQWKDKLRAQEAVRGIERNHKLVDASRRYDRDLPQVSGNDRERATRLSEKSGRKIDPEKVQLRNRITEAERSSNGTREGFEAELKRRGVHYRANVSRPTERSPEGRMNGYSYGLDDHQDKAGDQVWFKGSALGKQYGWKQQQERLAERGEEYNRRGGIAVTADEADSHRPSQTGPREIDGKAARSGVAAAPSFDSVNPPSPADSMSREHAREVARVTAREREQVRAERGEAHRESRQPSQAEGRQSSDQNGGQSESMSREQAREAARAAVLERESSRMQSVSSEVDRGASQSEPQDSASRPTNAASAELRQQPVRQAESASHLRAGSQGGVSNDTAQAKSSNQQITSTEGAPSMKPGRNQSGNESALTKEEAREEARRQAQERAEKREQDRQRGPEHER